jgi:hypothetical protein
MLVLGPFLIARRQPTELLEAVDQPFHQVALPIDRPIKWSHPALIRLPQDRHRQAPSPQLRPDLVTAVVLVPHHPLRTYLRLPATRPFDCPLLHQLFKHHRLMFFPWHQHNGHGTAVALSSQMGFGAEVTLASAECLRFRAPFAQTDVAIALSTI